MSKSRYKYYNTVWFDKVQNNIKGSLKDDILPTIKNFSFTNYTIPLTEQYRPDIIAYKFYGNSSYHWIITLINDIKNTPEGYVVNKVIKIPNPDDVLNL